MSKAFKCDGCGNLFEGAAANIDPMENRIDLGDLIFFYSFGREPTEEEAQQQQEHHHGSFVLVALGHTETHPMLAELCTGCRDKYLVLGLERFLMENPVHDE